MNDRKSSKKSQAGVGFDSACDFIAEALDGSARHDILDTIFSDGGGSDALNRLRSAMRTHTFPMGNSALRLRSIVDRFDARSRREGLHVLEGWDYRAHKFPDDIVPVLLLDYCARLGITPEHERASLAILLDQYFLSVLSLLAVRVWDEGDANINLDRVTSLVQMLNGAKGGKLRVIEDADTLLLLAIAYYNPEEDSFERLMQKVRRLDESHQRRVAHPFAGILGSHLRWGFRFMYERDVGRMRDDNVVDYPMLLFALAALMRSYARMCDEAVHGDERDFVVEGLLNGFGADPWAFTGNIPSCLVDHRAEYDECRDLLTRHRVELLGDFERHQPTGSGFSPLGFSCSFLSNAVVVTVAIAMGSDSARQQASLNALFTRERAGIEPAQSAEDLSERMMKFSAEVPERLGWGGAPLIVHDERDAVHWFNAVRRTL